MSYVLLYFLVLTVVSIVIMKKYARSAAGVVFWALLISFVICFSYQVMNYFAFGVDPFIEIAVAVQLIGGFLASVLVGIVCVQLKTTNNKQISK